MKRFVFPLARLERLREVRRTEARAGLARAVAAVRGWRDRAEAELARLERPTPLDGDDGRVEGAALRADAEWRAGRRAVARHARERALEAQDELRTRQRGYADAARDHRVVERLREKRFERWRLEAERDERTFLDEIHRMRLLRTRRETSPEELNE